ncbi:MAG: MurR/RpiR family transcriptional regulator [Alicyclobacillus sp.]|nr:MurR/RpiR family transcriptional regulator [Alicyclobacillus sp.]
MDNVDDGLDISQRTCYVLLETNCIKEGACITNMIKNDSYRDADKDNVFESGLTVELAEADLSPAERRVVEYCLSVPEHELALMTAEELATRAKVSRSTVVRVSKKFGFKGPKALAGALMRQSRRIMDSEPPSSDLDPAISLEDDPHTIARKVLVSASTRSLRFAETLSTSEQLYRAVEWLDTAKTIVLFGAGSSSMVAMDLYHRLIRLGLDVKYVEDTQTQYALATLMEAKDVGIYISYSGRTASTIRAAAIAKESGAHLIAVTGAAKSPLATICDVTIVTPGGIGLFGNDAAMTRILQVMLNEVLFHCLAVRNVSRLNRTKQIDSVLSRDKADKSPI